MPRFEIFIPKSPKVPMDLRLRLEAESWVEALKAGLTKAGEGGAAAENVLCDIKEDNSIHVTDATSGRVFQIIELPASDPSPEAPPEPIAAPPSEDQQDTIPEMPAAEPVPPVAAPKPAPLATPAPQPAPQPAPVAAPSPPPVPAPKPAQAPTPEPAAVPAPKPAQAPKPVAAPPAQTTTTASGIGRAIDFTSESTADLLEEIFEYTDQVNRQPDQQAALYFLLDLAMEKIGTDAGAVFLADINEDELYFGAARGPKADQVMDFRVKMGQGIVGFTSESGVGLAISDAQQDPRFYAAVSEKVGYPTRSILCVPLQADNQVFGALELINKIHNDTFTERDLGMANFIAQQLGRFLLGKR